MTTNSKAAPSQMINIRFGSLLPWPFQVMACLAIFIAFLLAPAHPWASVVIVICSVFIFTSAEGTQIDPVKQRFREYTSIFLFKTGEWVAYESMDKIYVNKNKVRQKMNPPRTGLTRSITFYEFSVFLKVSDQEIIQLVKHKNKDLVMRRARSWSDQLNIPLYDNTSEH